MMKNILAAIGGLFVIFVIIMVVLTTTTNESSDNRCLQGCVLGLQYNQSNGNFSYLDKTQETINKIKVCEKVCGVVI